MFNPCKAAYFPKLHIGARINRTIRRLTGTVGELFEKKRLNRCIYIGFTYHMRYFLTFWIIAIALIPASIILVSCQYWVTGLCLAFLAILARTRAHHIPHPHPNTTTMEHRSTQRHIPSNSAADTGDYDLHTLPQNLVYFTRHTTTT